VTVAVAVPVRFLAGGVSFVDFLPADLSGRYVARRRSRGF